MSSILHLRKTVLKIYIHYNILNTFFHNLLLLIALKAQHDLDCVENADKP